jgi:hypothetical protein
MGGRSGLQEESVTALGRYETLWEVVSHLTDCTRKTEDLVRRSADWSLTRMGGALRRASPN